jgi:hypothetical protein
VPGTSSAEPAVLASVTAVCRLCVRRAAVDGAGVSVVAAAGALSTLCATDDASASIEETQFTLGVGPCIDAHRSGVPLLLDDLEALPIDVDERWPGFTPAVHATGARALFALPLRIGAIVVGAMDLYRRTPGPLTDVQLAAALLAADAVALTLLGLDLPEGGDLTGRSSALRIEVHQAAGMVVEQLDVPIESALLILRSTAYARGVPVDDVAADVVAGRLRFPTEDG